MLTELPKSKDLMENPMGSPTTFELPIIKDLTKYKNTLYAPAHVTTNWDGYKTHLASVLPPMYCFLIGFHCLKDFSEHRKVLFQDTFHVCYVTKFPHHWWFHCFQLFNGKSECLCKNVLFPNGCFDNHLSSLPLRYY